ncbi:MAG: SDR family NAD(P)-dependent oxidoreductase [Acidimicrobiia bacterium]
MIDNPFATNLLDLTGKVAIITGGGTGIGAATARLFCANGADVAIAARTVDELDRVKAEVESATGRTCLAVRTDVKDEQQCIDLVSRTVSEFGKLDILVNNAGGTRMGPLKDLPTKGWDAAFDLNAKGPFFLTKEAGKHFIAQRSGNIVNISSGAGVNGVSGGAHYSAAKAALQMFTRVTAGEWGRYGIRANCIAVGGIASERAVAAWEVANLDVDRMGANTALRRTGYPIEIASVILFLASDASSYLSGQTISVDGGPGMSGIPETD